MNRVIEQLHRTGIIPVVVIDRARDAVPLAKALVRGGLPCAEITFRTQAAGSAICAMHENCPEILPGAGTVLTTEQADLAIAAGAAFIVSPGLNPEVVTHCISRNIPVIPGVATPTEIEQAIGLGLDIVKFFPAEASGGLKYIKAVAAPYHQIRFMPTGGINPQNVSEYLAYNRILACGGSWMVPQELILQGAFGQIEQLCREASALVKEARNS
jgi:2-dehydro-3-deoxyphosphogluconate aldolase/(4S)-4-hydroxy-2-oxoglutarate aldolase